MTPNLYKTPRWERVSKILFTLFLPLMLLLPAMSARADGGESNHCLKVSAADKVESNSDSRFWIILDEDNPSKMGDAVIVTMDVRADKEAVISTELHSNPGMLVSSGGVMDNIHFTTQWQTVRYAWTYANPTWEGGYSFAFNLNDLSEANNYYFDNISIKINGNEVVINGDVEGDVFSDFWYKLPNDAEPQQVSSAIEDNNPMPYAILNNGVLYFYYDNNRPKDAFGIRSWSNEQAQEITEVVINPSFEDYRPTSCDSWFSGCFNLVENENL